MLIEFFGRNFGSFRDEFHLSMLASDIDPGNDRGVIEVPVEGEDEPLRLLRCAAIYGPNASGKSNLLRAALALEFVLRTSAQTSSDEPLAPYEPFALDIAIADQPVMLGLIALLGRHVYEYRIEFERTRFVGEQLLEISSDKRERLFERDGREVHGPWTRDRQFKLLMSTFRPNALLLSLADGLAPGLARGLCTGFRRLLRQHDMMNDRRYGAVAAAYRAKHDEAFGAWLVDCLRSADIGIINYEADQVPTDVGPEQVVNERGARVFTNFIFELIHSGAHGPVKLPYSRESMGTRKLVELAPFIHELMHAESPRTYFIDEIAASMHPQLLEAIVRRFNCEAKPEDVRGQLIFATHETTLLDAEAKNAVLRRDQIYLTEKDSSGASRLYSVAEFKERNNLNMRRRYLQGRYGALPAIGSLGD